MSDDAEVTEQLATASSSAPFVRRMRDSADVHVQIKWMPETLVVNVVGRTGDPGGPQQAERHQHQHYMY